MISKLNLVGFKIQNDEVNIYLIWNGWYQVDINLISTVSYQVDVDFIILDFKPN